MSSVRFRLRSLVTDVDGVGQVGVYPVVAPVGDHVLVAWTDNTTSGSIIRVVRRRMS